MSSCANTDPLRSGGTGSGEQEREAEDNRRHALAMMEAEKWGSSDAVDIAPIPLTTEVPAVRKYRALSLKRRRISGASGSGATQ